MGEPCEICGCVGNHWPAYHSCLAALERRLADRIAKLEANALHDPLCRVQRGGSCNCFQAPSEPPAEQPSPWANVIGSMPDLTEPAETLSAKVDEAAFWKEKWQGVLRHLAAAERERDKWFAHGNEGWNLANKRTRQWKEAERERNEAKRLATADREENARLKAEISVVTSERDEALADASTAHALAEREHNARKADVAAERERCLAHVETYEPRRDVPADWTYQGALSRVAEAIRDATGDQ